MCVLFNIFYLFIIHKCIICICEILVSDKGEDPNFLERLMRMGKSKRKHRSDLTRGHRGFPASDIRFKNSQAREHYPDIAEATEFRHHRAWRDRPRCGKANPHVLGRRFHPALNVWKRVKLQKLASPLQLPLYINKCDNELGMAARKKSWRKKLISWSSSIMVMVFAFFSAFH